MISLESLQLISLDVGETSEGMSAQLYETGAMFKVRCFWRHFLVTSVMLALDHQSQNTLTH